MYTQQDFMNAQRGEKRVVWTLAILLAATLALTITLIALRIKWGAAAAAAVGGCLCYGFYSLKAKPYINYRRFLRDIREGLSRETDAWFVSLGGAPRTVDGVEVRDFLVRVGDEEEDERLFYWDEDKPLPRVEAGQKLHIVSYGNFVTALSVQ